MADVFNDDNLNVEDFSSNFLHKIVEDDLESGEYSRSICTRFPPEPNGYLHIGSAYAINISYTIAKKYEGQFNLRFDDTNPLKEDAEYVDSIIEDMKWLGFDPEKHIFYGSDYFDRIFEYAVELIKRDKAYVCDLSADEIKELRGTLTESGKNSPYRNRSVEENLELFEGMRSGKYLTGTKVLRAKIDMASPNINLRDPVIYRIQFVNHYKTKDKWCIYPMYDYAHPLQDYIEGITHSLCSIEFRDHRPLYEWVLEALSINEPPKQREFGRMNLSGVVTSKRYLKELVFGKFVDGWDDPRLPTLRGMRRRGYTPESIRTFLGEIGVSKNVSMIDTSMLEHSLREDLKPKVPVIMAVLNPLRVVITNYPIDTVEYLEIENNGENESMGKRAVPFSRVIYIEKEDFMEVPVKGFHRLFPGNEVRLKGGYFIKCEKVIKNEETGETIELHCSYDPETKSGNAENVRKVKGTIHWLEENNILKAEVRLYDKLILDEELLKNEVLGWADKLNPESMIVLKECMIEKQLASAPPESRYQFIRNGYFVVDNRYSTADALVFNRIVALKDTWKNKNKNKV